MHLFNRASEPSDNVLGLLIGQSVRDPVSERLRCVFDIQCHHDVVRVLTAFHRIFECINRFIGLYAAAFRCPLSRQITPSLEHLVAAQSL